MSRADWSFLEHLLEEGQEHSTRVGRVWLTVLFLFRMLVLGAAAESAWDDEQCNFVCNTQQPGCESVCYDRAFPISHFRYFVLQVIFVSTPTVFYFGYVAVRTARDKSEREEEEDDEEEEEEEEKGQGRAATEVTFGRSGGKKASQAAAVRNGKELEEIAEEEEEEEGDARGGRRGKDGKAAKSPPPPPPPPPPQAPKLKGRLLGAYAASVLATVLLEAGFMAGLWLLYGGFFIAARYECVGPPCPHTVDCFVSRPTEKTIFTVYTQAIAGLSLLLNLTELLHLLQLAVSQRLEKRYGCGRRPGPGGGGDRGDPRTPSPPGLPIGRGGVGGEAPMYRPVPVACYPEPPRGYGLADPPPPPTPRSEVNWGGGGEGDSDGDIPPSYLNCLGGMGSSPRSHVKKKHVHAHGKHRKNSHKGHAKLKHYV
ncbi:hypothetical protein NHX12_023827 [Muraenolepis orangiensis]|uniref:Gap junction protein n=1 Tax=Muraenolepis orangiensis TaxID=630683 RepID=A0A9Q0EL89_9TELE|nr:hypothetical protein NHX12_023827 [Muraenolepis orangiensis]